MDNQIQKLKNSYASFYKRAEINFLIMAVILVTGNYTDGKKYASKSKNQLVDILLKEIPFKKIIESDEYYNNLPPKTTAAIEKYRDAGYVTINEYMRSGKIKFNMSDIFMGENNLTIPLKHFDSTIDLQKYICAKVASQIKKYIKNQEISQVKTNIKLIRKTIYGAKLNKNEKMILFRGENSTVLPITMSDESPRYKDNAFKFDALNLTQGSKFEQKSFSSFSFSPLTALEFNNGQSCCMYRFTYHTYDTIPYLIFPSTGLREAEVLFPPCAFIVTKITYIQSPLASDLKFKLYDIKIQQ